MSEIIDIKEKFKTLSLRDWQICGNPNGGGQASTIEVKNSKNDKTGVFRYLKRTSEIDVKRFKREVSFLSNPLNKHPNLVNILEHSDFGSSDYWYISEKGEAFKSRWYSIAEQSNDDEIVTIAISVIQKLLDGLKILHSQNIVHRDIKPDNLIWNQDNPVIIDFGLIFDPHEERLTPIDSAVGNAKYSPDQMMNRMDEVPAWLDIFQLSQLLIWMISEKPTKNWTRPLDWRWVIFRRNISPELALSVRAVLAICSNPNTSPKNATELKGLLNQIFKEESEKTVMSENFEAIKKSIQKGQAISVLAGSEDHELFSSTHQIFEKALYLPVFNIFENLSTKFRENNIPFEFVMKQSYREWIEHLLSINGGIGYQNNYPFDFYCGSQSGNHFYFTIVNQFFGPSQLHKTPQAFKIHEDLLPYCIQIGFGSTPENVQSEVKFDSTFLAIRKDGTIVKSKTFDSLSRKHYNELFFTELENTINNIVMSPRNWELINK